jgi:hypothetical protein
MDYELAQHARDVLAERHIPLEWLERALGEPELKQPDPQRMPRWSAATVRYRNTRTGCCGWWSIPRLPRSGW